MYGLLFLYLQLHEENVSPNFLEFLSSLGWAVSVSAHAGWTGHVSTSWRATAQVNVPQPAHSNHGGALYNGDTHVLYWADVSSEVAFVVPTQSYLMASSDSLEETSSYSSDISSGQGKYLKVGRTVNIQDDIKYVFRRTNYEIFLWFHTI